MQFDAEISRAIDDALASLPTHVSSQFTERVETKYNTGPCEVDTLIYNRKRSPVCNERDLPAGVSTEQITLLLDSTMDRLGKMLETSLVLNIRNSSISHAGRLLFIRYDELDRALDVIYPEHNLTPAEKRALYLVLCGYSMPEAANLDEVTNDTKFKQIKSAKGKLGISRQADLATITLTRLLVDANSNLNVLGHAHEFVREYHKAHMPPTVRLHIMVGKSGAQHRVLDMGPADGKPLITLHPQIVPYLRKEDIDVLHSHNLRLIWPLRNGAFGPLDKQLDLKSHIDLHMESIEVASELIESNENINILALMSGGFYAINYAHNYQERVNRIVFVGACVECEESKRRFLKGIIRITSRSPLLTGVLLHFLGNKLRDRSNLTDFLTDLYKDSEADMEIVNKELSSDDTFDAIQKRIVSSERSIVQDIFCMASPNWNLLNELNCGLHFIHGAQDPAHRASDIRELAEIHDAQLDILKDAGQMVYYAHIESVAKLL